MSTHTSMTQGQGKGVWQLTDTDLQVANHWTTFISH